MRVAMRDVRLARISAAGSAMNSTPAGTWRTTCAPAAASSVSSSASSPRGQVAKWLAGGSASRSGRTGCGALVRRDSGFKNCFQIELKRLQHHQQHDEQQHDHGDFVEPAEPYVRLEVLSGFECTQPALADMVLTDQPGDQRTLGPPPVQAARELRPPQ